MSLLYERRPLHARRHPGRRPGRRGRHRERPHDRRRARPAARGRAPPVGGAGRGVHAARHLRGAQRRPGGGGPAPLRQPPQHRGRLAAAEGPGDDRPAGPPLLGLPARRGGGRPGLPDPRRVAGSGWARWASRSTRSWRSSPPSTEVYEHCRHWEEHRHDLAYEIDGVVVKLDDLARRDGSAPRPRRRAGPSPTSSRRRSARRCCATSRSRSAAPARPRPSPCSSRCSSAARPSASPRCTTRTRWRRRTCARATPSSCARPATSSPRWWARCSSSRPEGSEAWSFPTTCPVCEAPLQRLEGESDTFCTNVDCPAQRAARIEHFASRGAMDIEGFGEQRVRLFLELGLLADPGDIYTIDLERVQALEGFGAVSVGNLAGGHRGVQGPPARQPPRRPQRPPPRRRRRPAPRRPLRPPRPAGRRLRGGDRRGRGHRAHDRRLGGGLLPQRAQPGPRREAAPRRGELRGAQPPRPSPRSWPARRSSSPARSSVGAGNGRRRPSRPAGASPPARSRRRRPRSWWVPSRAPPS